MGWVPRKPEKPPLNVTSMLYSDTAHFYWSFDVKYDRTRDTAQNFYSPWQACNTSGLTGTGSQQASTVRIKNTGTTVSINRCEKWPPLDAQGYFDLLLDGKTSTFSGTIYQNFQNPDASKFLCSGIYDKIYRDTTWAKYYGDLKRGLFDGNCANQVPCPRGVSNSEDCIVMNLNPSETDETKKECIYIGNFNTNPEKFWQEKCLINPSKCEDNGFTVSLWIKYNSTWLNEPNTTRFLVGTDYGKNPHPENAYLYPDEHPVIGWGLWHYTSNDEGQNYLRVIVTDVNYMYIQDVAVTDANGVVWPLPDDSANTFWTNIGFRWQRATKAPTMKDYFIDVFLFGRQCEFDTGFEEDNPGCILLTNTNSSVANGTGVYEVFPDKTGAAFDPVTGFDNATAIYIGCQGDDRGSFGTRGVSQKRFHYTSAVIDDVAFWAWRLRDEEIPYLLGGKAMPKVNINPDRCRFVDLLPEPVNNFYTVADKYYKVYPSDFTEKPAPYIGDEDVIPLSSPAGMVNGLTNGKWFAGRSDPRATVAITDQLLLKATYATQLMNSSSYIYVDPETITDRGTVDRCPHSLDTCEPLGFSLSIWVFLPSTASLRIMNDHYTIIRNIYGQPGATAEQRLAKTWELYTEGNHVFVRVGSRPAAQFPGDCSKMLGRWVNLGFSWRSDLGIATYVNGLPTPFVPSYPPLTSTSMMGAPAITPNVSNVHAPFITNNHIIIGSDGYLSSSLAGMAVNDLAIWQTYIFPFETYKFMGMSEKEAVVLWNATNVWTADYFIVRDRTLYWDKIGGMWLYPDIGVIKSNIEDSDSKGHTLMTRNTSYSFLGFRDPDTNTIFLNHTVSCLTNPGLCDTSGATYGLYVYINQPINHPGRHYILTSGNIADHCVGVAMWLEVDTTSVPNRVLFAEVSRYADFNVNNAKTANYAVWRISVPGMDIRNCTWYHFSITWSMESGLFFFINGVIKGWASRANIVGVDSITDAKPIWRQDDRVMMGINSFYDGLMSSTTFVSFETLAVYHRMFNPLDVPKAFGLIENPWYGNATIWFDRMHFISNWQQSIYDMRLAIAKKYVNAKYKYPFKVNLTPLTARFSEPESIAPLTYINVTEGFWKRNFTVAMWLKINANYTSRQMIFTTDKYLDDNTVGGIAIVAIGGGLTVSVAGQTVCSLNNTNTTVVTGVWFNLALSFNVLTVVNNIVTSGVTTCWINGTLTTSSYLNPAPRVTVDGQVVNNNATFIAGGTNGPQDFEIYQLAIYPSAMSNIAQLGLMMGMPQQEAIYLITGDYYWSFDGPAHDLFVPRPFQLAPEASFDIDRRVQGRAIKTSSTAKSCVNLGNFAGTCLTNVGMCNTTGFVFSIWIKLFSLSVNGYIFSTGGQQPGEPGIYISLTQGILGVGVSNGTFLWSRLRIYIATNDLWFNLMFRWNQQNGLTVYVNGQLQTDDVAVGQASSIRNAQVMYLFTNATVGCSNSDMSKVVPVYVDDIWFKANYSTVPLTTDDCPASAQYRNVFAPQMLDSTGTIPPYNPIKKSLATPVFEILYPPDFKAGSTVMDMDKQCPGDLSKCPNGFTVSFWFLLPSVKRFSRPLLQLRSSTYQGIQVYLDNEKLQQSLRVDMHNATHRWLVTVADYIDVNKWLQLTAAWDTRQLTVYTLNRQYAPVYAQKDAKPGSNNDWSATYSVGVTLESGVWQYYVEDLNIWYRYLDNLKAYPMGVSCVSISTDFVPDDLPTPPVLASSLTVAGVCYLTSEDGKSCLCTKEQWDRGAVQGLSSADYFKILTMLQGKSLSSSSDDDLGIAKYQPAISVQDLLAVKKQIMNGAIMTLTDRTKNGLSKTAYDFVQLCSSVLYPIRSKETWEALAEQGDSAMGVADALEVFGDKVVANLAPIDVQNDTMNLNNSIDIHSDNIIFTGEVWSLANIRSANFTNYAFPNYARIKIQSATFSKKWASGDNTDTIMIPASVLYQQYNKATQDKVSIVASIYDTMGQMVPPVLDPKSSQYRSDVKASDVGMISRIISLKFTPPIDEKDGYDVRVTLQHSVDVDLKKKMAFCAFYTKDRTWNTTGCYVINGTAHATICSCNHLTSFAVLMQPLPFVPEPIDALVLSILSYVGVIISMLCLITLFYLFVSKTKLHNERNTIHINLVVALFLADMFFLFTGPAAYFRTFCRACAALMHFFYTATFMWLLMEGTYLFNAVVSGVLKGRLCCMIPMAWGVPVLVVAGVLAVDPEAYGGDDRCWLSFDKGFIFAFIGPILLIVILNAGLLGLIVYNMPNTVLRRDTKFYGKVLRGIRHAAVLLPLFGVTWLFGLFTVNQSLIVFQYLFVIFNSMQGFFIFLGFGWFQPDVRRYMCSRDDDQEDEDDPHKDVVNSESDLKTILSTMPPPTPELDRKPTGAGAALASSFDISEIAPPSPPPDAEVPSSAMPTSARQVSAREPSARQMSSRQRSAASARARTSFMRPATSLMRPKSGAPSSFGGEANYGFEEPTEETNDDETEKARELMDYLLDGKRVKDVPDFATSESRPRNQDQ